MRTTDSSATGTGTFTHSARQAQLVAHAIEALAEVGYQQTTVAEVARRAGVSKGVVTYHFPARDDLMWAVVADVFSSITEHVGVRLGGATSETFLAAYIGGWVDFFRTHSRDMTAIVEIWVNFRDSDGHPHLGVQTLGNEQALVEAALMAGQADGTFCGFSPRVMAVTLKAALDGLLSQLGADPGLDLDAYGTELIALFERATSSTPTRATSPPIPLTVATRRKDAHQ
jgi:TetR/AcrR family transcriptional regulator, fatty acid metabolism regulator protein